MFLDFSQTMPKVMQALYQAHLVVQEQSTLAPRLYHLLVLRASQLNGCAYCVNMHASDALEAGETQQRLNHLPVYQHSEHFDASEKAALDWIEATTDLTDQRQLIAKRSALLAHFDEAQISTLTAISAMINLWNRLGIAGHHQ